MNKYTERIYNGIVKENPTFVLMLGMCPTLAVTTSAINGLGMGLSTTAVLIFSNLIIAALRNIIPDRVRIPAFIVIVASLVTMVQLLIQAYIPFLYDALGIYIPLIVVNCIILGRAESYASKNAPIPSAFDGIGMGLAATFVLLGSNIVISLLKNIIPDKVRIPCYIVVIAGFVTILSSLLQAYVQDVYSALGIFLPLIVVNCIILGRAEMFASKHNVFEAALDGIGMGLGFTLALVIIGSIREILGSGTWFGIPVTVNLFDPLSIFVLAPGGFLVYGCVIAAVNKLTSGKAIKKKEFGCEGCPNASACGSCNGCAEGEKGEC